MSGRPPATSRAAVVAAVGAAAAVSQVLLLRELMVACGGNELAAGIGLTCWMMITAAGSAVGVWLLRRGRGGGGGAILMAGLGLVVAVPISFFLLQLSRTWLGPPAGEVVAPHQVLAIAAVALGPPCLAIGVLFPLLCRRSEGEGTDPTGAAARVFWIEALGFGAAGLILGLALGVGGGWTLPWAGDGGGVGQLVAVRDTPYARVALRAGEGQHDWVIDGLWSGSYPDPEEAERTAHYPLLLHPEPRTVLQLGGAVSGVPAQVLRHPSVTRLDVVELDPVVVALARAHLPGEATASLDDPRVTLHHGDGRAFVRGAEDASYDVVLVVLPDPHNGQLNRFYSVEFFDIAMDLLAPGGLLAVGVTGSPDMLGPTQAEYVASVRATLDAVFPAVVVLPGSTVRFVCAVEPGGIVRDAQAMARRHADRGLETRFVTPFSLSFDLGPLGTDYLDAVLDEATASPPNRDLIPVCFFQDTRLRATAQSPRLRSLYEALGSLRTGWLVALVALGALVHLGLAWRGPWRPRARRAAVPVAVAAVGATGIVVEVALILGYQVAYGTLFARLAVVVAAYMVGLAAGSWLVARGWIRPGRAPLIAVQLGLAVTCAALAMAAATGLAGGLPGWAEPAIPLLLAGVGAAAGVHFPCAVRVQARRTDAGVSRSHAGALYAVDLAGAAIAALAVSAVLIPVLGVPAVLILVAVVDAAAVVVLVGARGR